MSWHLNDDAHQLYTNHLGFCILLTHEHFPFDFSLIRTFFKLYFKIMRTHKNSLLLMCFAVLYGYLIFNESLGYASAMNDKSNRFSMIINREFYTVLINYRKFSKNINILIKKCLSVESVYNFRSFILRFLNKNKFSNTMMCCLLMSMGMISD